MRIDIPAKKKSCMMRANQCERVTLGCRVKNDKEKSCQDDRWSCLTLFTASAEVKTRFDTTAIEVYAPYALFVRTSPLIIHIAARIHPFARVDRIYRLHAIWMWPLRREII